MTPAQRKVYFRLWAAALKTCWTRSGKSFTRCSSDDLAVEVDGLAFAAAWQEQRGITADDLRHAAHRVALGRDKSSSKLSNRDLDRVWALFRLLADPLNLAARLEWEHPERGARRRHDAVIHTAVPEAYARHVAGDKFGTRNLDALTDEQTAALATTLRQRQAAHDHDNIPF